MAGDWIKMRTNLGTDPDVIEIAARLGIDEFSVVGRLHAVWSWLDCHTNNGTNVRILSQFIDRLAGIAGFSDAMRSVKWLAGNDGNLRFPGYSEHNGETAKRRGLETQRKRKQRDKCPSKNGTDVPRKPGPEKRRVLLSKDKSGTHIPRARASERGSAEELEAYAVELELPATDGTDCFDTWEGNGWRNGENPVRDWRATMRRWKRHGYMASQKAKPSSNGLGRGARGPDRIPTTETPITPDMLKL